MNFLLLKLSIFAAVAAPVASSDESSLLRGSEQEVSFVIEATINDSRFHFNSINCRGVSTCRVDSDYSQPFVCEKGQKLCCQLSNIKESNFGDPDRYGKCSVGCIPDGSPVWMDLYESRFGPQVDTNVEDLCCSGVCADCTSISSTGFRKDGVQWLEGSSSGTCGDGEIIANSS
mmetsp:Transcript_5863/g.10713  ORF Transcript_5863/g.10713 Transcript_5863/m.10713 type:complete len:174 (+) Transcript_5863:19-540(+)